MKTKKIILTISLVLIALFAFVGCTENSVLMNSLIRQSESMTATTATYESENLDNNVELLSLSNEEYYVITLSDEGEPNLLIEFNELRLELIALHNEIVVEVDTIKASVESIKTNAITIRDNDYILLPGDKEIITDYIDILKGYKEDLEATRGQAYQRIYELAGTYTRDNLENIIQVFEEVKLVLEYRLEIVREGVIVFNEIDLLLLDYMES